MDNECYRAGSERRQAMIDDQLNGGGNASSPDDLGSTISQGRREARIRSPEPMRGFFHGLLAAGNPQLTLAAHDRFCERLSRQYRSGFE